MEAIYRSTFPYCIVEFTEEKTICVVPTLWLAEEEGVVYTKWPRDNIKRHALIKSTPQDSWKMYPVKVVHYSRSCQSANESLRFYQDHTDIELCSEDEDEESQSLIAPAPAPKKFKQASQEACSLNLDTNYITASAIQPSQCDSCLENRAMLELVVSKLNYVVEELKELKQNQRLYVDQSIDSSLSDTYPLTSAEHVKCLEDELSDEDVFLKLAKHLGQYGGRDTNDCTRRVLPLLMTNQASRGFNWIGGYGKIGMKACPRILQLISVAVRQSIKTARQSEVEEVVKRWLRTAGDREGGRNRRKKQEENSEQ